MKRKHTKVVPVSPGKKAPPSGRVYSEYDKKLQATTAEKKKRAERNKASREAVREGRRSKGDGKDVHHVGGFSKSGKPKTDRVRVESRSTNRGRK